MSLKEFLEQNYTESSLAAATCPVYIQAQQIYVSNRLTGLAVNSALVPIEGLHKLFITFIEKVMACEELSENHNVFIFDFDTHDGTKQIWSETFMLEGRATLAFSMDDDPLYKPEEKKRLHLIKEEDNGSK